MPATALPVTTAQGLTGVTWPATDGTAADTANGNSFTNGPNVLVVIANTGASSYTVTFTTPYTAGGYAIEDPVKTLTAGQRQVFGPFDNDLFGDTVVLTANNVAVKFIVVQHT